MSLDSQSNVLNFIYFKFNWK